MERVEEDAYVETGTDEVDTMENLRSFTKEELVKLCSGFAKENMKFVHWMYKYHRDILRDYENKYLGGHHIEFV